MDTKATVAPLLASLSSETPWLTGDLAACARVILAFLVFTLLGISDAQAYSSGVLDTREIVRAVVWATLLTVAALLPLAIVAAAVMLVVTVVTDAVGLSHAYLNAPVEWAVLYVPWICQYVLVLRYCLAGARKRPLLPMRVA
jgi:hypothetical protein